MPVEKNPMRENVYKVTQKKSVPSHGKGEDGKINKEIHITCRKGKRLEQAAPSKIRSGFFICGALCVRKKICACILPIIARRHGTRRCGASNIFLADNIADSGDMLGKLFGRGKNACSIARGGNVYPMVEEDIGKRERGTSYRIWRGVFRVNGVRAGGTKTHRR